MTQDSSGTPGQRIGVYDAGMDHCKKSRRALDAARALRTPDGDFLSGPRRVADGMQKADMKKPPIRGFLHVGLLVNEPAGGSGLLNRKSSDDSDSHRQHAGCSSTRPALSIIVAYRTGIATCLRTFFDGSHPFRGNGRRLVKHNRQHSLPQVRLSPSSATC